MRMKGFPQINADVFADVRRISNEAIISETLRKRSPEICGNYLYRQAVFILENISSCTRPNLSNIALHEIKKDLHCRSFIRKLNDLLSQFIQQYRA